MCECENVQVCKWLNETFITERTKATFAHLHICTLTRGGYLAFVMRLKKLRPKSWSALMALISFLAPMILRKRSIYCFSMRVAFVLSSAIRASAR